MSPIKSDNDVYFLHNKVSYLYLVLLIFIVIVLARLFYLQVYQGGRYRNLSAQISVREGEIKAERGFIFDRNYKILADNRPYFEIVVIPQYLKDKKRTIDSLTSLIPLDREDIKNKLYKARFEPHFMPVVLVEDAPYEWVATIREYERPYYDEDTPYYLEGVEVIKTSLRKYLYPELFAHALGYLREIDKKTLKKFNEKYLDRYSRGDLMGASGLEKNYDLILRGFDGINARVVDAKGREVKGNPDVELLERRASYAPIAGHHLKTSLDFEAQKAAADALRERRGAVVALDPNTGEVLVLYSSPSFNANRIIKNVDKAYWQKINLDEDRYLYNRTVQAAYPPGSIYKVVTAFAGLDTEKISLKTGFSCHGGMRFGNRFFKCWNKGGHGYVTLLKGIAQSCDVFFYNVGNRVGVDILREYAEKYGLAKKTGIDIPYEQPGLIPTKKWKKKRYNQKWIKSETLSLSIGQGYNLLTPVQAARMVAIIANGGYWVKPHLAKVIVSRGKKVIEEKAIPLGEKVIPDESLKPIRQGLIDVIHGAGTAKRLRKSPYKIAGKTGTAQVIGHDSKVKRSKWTKPHGWFMAFAPYDNPKIAVAVIVENGGSGGAVAGPVAMEVIDTYLSKL